LLQRHALNVRATSSSRGPMHKAALLVASLFAVPFAFAQASAPTPPPPPPPPAAANPPVAGEATPAPPSAADHADEGRVRWGINALLGAYLPSPPMVTFGVEGRVGWSFNRMFAAYATV